MSAYEAGSIAAVLFYMQLNKKAGNKADRKNKRSKKKDREYDRYRKTENQPVKADQERVAQKAPEIE